MLKLLGSLVLGAILLSGCRAGPSGIPAGGEVIVNNGSDYEVYTWHDNAKHVTCWILSVASDYGGRGGISCLTDHELVR